MSWIPGTSANSLSNSIQKVRKLLRQENDSLIAKAAENNTNPYEFFNVSEKVINFCKMSQDDYHHNRQLKTNQAILYAPLDPEEHGLSYTPIGFMESRGPKLLSFLIEYREDYGLLKVIPANESPSFMRNYTVLDEKLSENIGNIYQLLKQI